MTDAHPFIWYLADKLPPAIDRIFTSAEKGEAIIFVPTIVLAECLYLAETGKIKLNLNELISKMELSSNFVPVSFNFQVFKLLPEIKIKEIHDRVIVATAKLLNAKLITKDREIRESGIVEVVW
ncbi:type II toxin-antitoxin system VapC family toxin [Archaeoglobus neptunius]|uniref:type II toxin-antitoxin system VapC family toxin n=1 Tax=Archaeoglobus neptunius TaxID=2798580 RepID=UPI002EDAA20D